eukprot:s12184_g2.t1
MEACNHLFTPLEQEIEDLAIEYDVDEKYDEEAVLRLYGMLERTRLQGSKAVKRKSETASTSWTTGMFTHGGNHYMLKKQQYIIDEDGALESFSDEKITDGDEDGALESFSDEKITDGDEVQPLDGLLLRMNEYQQQMVDEMMDRASLLQDLLEEEEARMQDLQQVHQGQAGRGRSDT